MQKIDQFYIRNTGKMDSDIERITYTSHPSNKAH